MFRSTPLQVGSVVKIAPGSGAAKIFPQRKHPARVIINANLVFISVLVCLSYFLIPGGHSRGDPRSLLVRGGRCCDRPGETFYSPTLYGNSGRELSGYYPD